MQEPDLFWYIWQHLMLMAVRCFFPVQTVQHRILAMKLYNYCISQPEIPDVAMSFSDANVTAYVDGNSQRTKEIILKQMNCKVSQ